MNNTGNTKNIGIMNNIGNAKHSMKGQFDKFGAQLP